ncbi:MAG: hypothetical protein AB8B99_14030 [Phormidesmis sp.]
MLHSVLTLHNKLCSQAPDSSPLKDSFQVFPEQGGGMPDVELRMDSGQSIWIEATHVSTQPVMSEGDLEKSLEKIKRLENVLDNPIYRSIQQKAKQAEKWHRGKLNDRTQDPIVLVICVSQNLYQLKIQDRFSSTEMEKPVYSALADDDWWNIGRIMTCSDDKSWPWDRRSSKVQSSELISAVLLVPLRNEHQVLPFKAYRKADPFLIRNPSPLVTLSRKQEKLLMQIPFNEIAYRSGRQNWEEWKSSEETAPTALERYRREAYWNSGFTWSFLSDRAFKFTIPTKLVVRLLAEDISATEVWDNRVDDLGRSLKFAALFGQQIASISYVQPETPFDGMSCIEVRVAGLKSLRPPTDTFYISCSLTANTLSSIELSPNALVALLSGELPKESLWQGIDKQHINAMLRQAMSNAQDITAASIADLTDDVFDKRVVFSFGPVTQPTVRVEKK